MGDNTPKQNVADVAKQMAAQLREEARLEREAGDALMKALSDLTSSVQRDVAEYNSDAITRKTIDTIAASKKKQPASILLEIAVQNLMATDEYQAAVPKAAMQGLTLIAGIPEADRENPAIAAVQTLLTAPENTSLHRNGAMEAVRNIVKDMGKSATATGPAKPTKPTSGKPAAAPSSAEMPVQVGAAWTGGDDVPVAPAPGSGPKIDLGINMGDAGGFGQFAAVKDNDDIKKDVLKLMKDVKTIQRMTLEAKKPEVKSQYNNLDNPGNRTFIAQLGVAANKVQKEIEMLALNHTPDGQTTKINVDSANRHEWEALLEESTKQLNKALTKFEGAEFAVKKARNPTFARDRLASEMYKTVTDASVLPKPGGAQEADLTALDNALTPPSLWQRKAPLIVSTTAAALVLSLAGFLATRGGSKEEAPRPAPVAVAQNDRPKEPAKPKENVVPKAPVKAVELAPAAPPKAPVEDKKDEAVAEAAPPPRVVDRKPGAPKGPDMAAPVAAVDAKVDVEKLTQDQLREFVTKNVIPYLKAQYPNTDGRNPVLSVFKNDKWKVEYPQTLDWHQAADEARKAKKDVPAPEHNGGMLFITDEKGNNVLPVVLGNTNNNFSILNGQSYHTEWGDPLVLTKGNQKETNIGNKVVAPAVSISNDVLNGAKVRLNQPRVAGHDPQAELQYVGVPMTRLPHVDGDLALRFVAATPLKKSGGNQLPIQGYNVVLGALDPKHEKFDDNKRKSYTTIMEGVGTLTSRIVYKEVGPSALGEVNLYCEKNGIEVGNYDGFKLGFGYAGPLIPHQVLAPNGACAPAVIRVQPASHRYMENGRGYLGTINLREVREVKAPGPDGNLMIKQVPQPGEAPLGEAKPVDLTSLMQFMALNPGLNDRYTPGNIKAIYKMIIAEAPKAFPLMEPQLKRYRNGDGGSGAPEQFELTGRNIGNVTVYSGQQGGYNPGTQQGQICVRVALPGDEKTLQTALDALEKEALKVEGALAAPAPGGGGGIPKKNGKKAMRNFQMELNDDGLGLNDFDRRKVAEMFAMGSSDAETALKGDAHSAAAMLLTKITMHGDKKLADMVGPQNGPYDDTTNIMLKLVNSFREAVASGEIAATGLSRTEVADVRKPPQDRHIG